MKCHFRSISNLCFLLVIIIAISSCDSSEKNRFIVVSNGSGETYPIFLDTKTKELYMIDTDFNHVSKYRIIKKSLSEAEKK